MWAECAVFGADPTNPENRKRTEPCCRGDACRRKDIVSAREKGYDSTLALIIPRRVGVLWRFLLVGLTTNP